LRGCGIRDDGGDFVAGDDGAAVSDDVGAEPESEIVAVGDVAAAEWDSDGVARAAAGSAGERRGGLVFFGFGFGCAGRAPEKRLRRCDLLSVLKLRPPKKISCIAVSFGG